MFSCLNLGEKNLKQSYHNCTELFPQETFWSTSFFIIIFVYFCKSWYFLKELKAHEKDFVCIEIHL